MARLTLRSPLFRKFLAAALLLIVTALGATDILLTRSTAVRERTHAEQKMETAARILVHSQSNRLKRT